MSTRYLSIFEFIQYMETFLSIKVIFYCSRVDGKSRRRNLAQVIVHYTRYRTWSLIYIVNRTPKYKLKHDIRQRNHLNEEVFFRIHFLDFCVLLPYKYIACHSRVTVD